MSGSRKKTNKMAKVDQNLGKKKKEGEIDSPNCYNHIYRIAEMLAGGDANQTRKTTAISNSQKRQMVPAVIRPVCNELRVCERAIKLRRKAATKLLGAKLTACE